MNDNINTAPCCKGAASLPEMEEKAIREYLGHTDRDNPPGLARAASGLLASVADLFDAYNAVCPPGRKLKLPTVPDAAMVAGILLRLRHIVNVSHTGVSMDSDTDILAVYMEDGPNRGIYSTDGCEIRNLARECNSVITSQGLKEVVLILKDRAPRVTECRDLGLVPVNNGIFDYNNKTLLPFSPECVFLRKCRVDYVPNPANPVLHNPDDGTDWDVESWMDGLVDDPQGGNLLWQVAGAAIRPYNGWGKIALLYGEKGNNGKGSYCVLLRNLCGEGNHAGIPLCNFSKDFSLGELLHVSAVITDENDVGGFIDASANLKAVATNDRVQINRKFRQPVTCRPWVFIIQCVNELPRVRDRSDSFYRRLLIIPFAKSFTGGERRYIKSDYLCRRDVLQYALWKVLHMDYYRLDEPAACRAMLEEYKESNDPVRQFWAEFRGRFAWDLLPYRFLYDLYISWSRKYNPGGQALGSRRFNSELRGVVGDDPDWKAAVSVTTGYRLSIPERLINEYNLTAWKNGLPSFDPDKIATPDARSLSSSYNGLVRK